MNHSNESIVLSLLCVVIALATTWFVAHPCIGQTTDNTSLEETERWIADKISLYQQNEESVSYLGGLMYIFSTQPGMFGAQETRTARITITDVEYLSLVQYPEVVWLCFHIAPNGETESILSINGKIETITKHCVILKKSFDSDGMLERMRRIEPLD
ncbi:MAG: hypothetical protein IPH05_10315 [Flavobacteriales bacterium]|nr:hypothetical protein [Flavobacteriales bacterium]